MEHRQPHAQLNLDDHALLKRTALIESRIIRDYIFAAANAASEVRIAADKVIDMMKISSDSARFFEVMLHEELEILPAMLRCTRIRHCAQ
ncbi:MAG: hypothetical protein ABIV25_09230 [Paracoccaceae bacterium]